MVIVNTTQGTTLQFDLVDDHQYRSLLTFLRSGSVTALALLQNSVQHTLSLPNGFRGKPKFGVERVINGSSKPIAERVYLQAGEMRVSVTHTFNSKLVRTDLVKTGKQRFDPLKRRG
jgi:hypothetical protein